MEIKGKKQEVFNKMVEFLDKCSDEETIHCYFSKKETKKIRSTRQNALFWKLFTNIWDYMWETKEDVKIYLLSAIFWVSKKTLWKTSIDIPNEWKTSLLDKEKWTFFIKTILEFCKAKNIWITITGEEIKSLYDSYN